MNEDASQGPKAPGCACTHLTMLVVRLPQPDPEFPMRVPVHYCAFHGTLAESAQAGEAPCAYGPDGYHVHPTRCTRARFVCHCHPAAARQKAARTRERAQRVQEGARLAIARATTLHEAAQALRFHAWHPRYGAGR